jgi:tRNA A-37 threonylcarbamoyl transferase component Bud32
MSDANRWRRVGALFDQALAVADTERLSMIRSSLEPPDVQEEVIKLLHAHDTNDGFLEPPALLQPGAEVGNYRIERLLGSGGMGVVYLARETRLHRNVALKALPPHLTRDDRMRARLQHEARAAAALSHPSIATVYAFEEIGEQIFIASEYLEGRTLRDEMAGGPMAAERAVPIARAIASGLQAAHERGIVHRDLKPENVMLTTTGAVKIVDFGIAQTNAPDLAPQTRLTQMGELAGTVPYMAPEQLLGNPTSPQTDQFAFGVLLYEMLTGHHPFGTGQQQMARIIITEPDYAEMPPELWQIVKRTIEKKPEDRFASTKDLVDALSAPGTLHSSTAGASVTPGTHLGWWQTHQLVVALGYWFMVYPAWAVHKWTGRYGVLTFLATLAVIIVGGNVRLHLWFTSKTYPGQLRAQLASIGRLVQAADVAFSLVMIATGLVIADAHTGWSALFVAFGLGGALAFLVIEPATARAAGLK